jgi:hypothetical protein
VPSMGSGPRASTQEKVERRASTIVKVGWLRKWASAPSACVGEDVGGVGVERGGGGEGESVAK